jgi:hypothetical protein
LKDTNGVFYAGITGNAAWRFTTKEIPYLATPILTGDSSNINFLVSTNSVYNNTDQNKVSNVFDSNGTTYHSLPTAFSSGLPNTNTAFSTGNTSIPGVWIKISLNEIKVFNYCKISQYANPVDFKLYGSNDDITYTEFNSQSGYVNGGLENQWGSRISFAEQNSKHIVLLVTKIFSGGLLYIQQLEFGYYHAPYLATPTLSATVNPDFKVSASSIYSNLYEGWNLFDNNSAGYWTSVPGTYEIISPYWATNKNTFNSGSGSPTNGAWVKIELNEEKIFNYYKLGQYNTSGSTYRPAAFIIWGSNDNINYTKINEQTNYSILGTTGVWNPNISVGNQQYKFIVFQVTRMDITGDFVSVVNLEFGYDAP